MPKGGVYLRHISDYTNTGRYVVLENLHGESMELGLLFCGAEDCEPGHRYGPNERDSYVMHFVQSGKGVLEIGGKLYELGAGDAFLIPPETEAWYEADLEDPWKYLWIGFAGLKSNECVINAGFAPGSPAHKIECMEQIQEYIGKILGAHKLSFQDELRRNGILMLIFSELIEDYRKHAPGAKIPSEYPGSMYVKNAIEYIARNYNKKVKINELADYIGVNRSYLTSCFKKTMGCSPQNYLLNIRMEKAKSLLAKTNMQVNVIANSVGYQDQLAFSKIFKQYYGMSPKSFREMEKSLAASSEKDILNEE